VQVGILGGTGPAGGALAVRLASVGVDVVVGSRSKERAADACQRLTEAWPDRDLPLSGGDNEMAAGADVVVVSTPWDGAAPTAQALADALDGKVVISMANALALVGKEFQPLVLPRGSVAQHVQAAAPGALVAAAFHHLPAKELAAIDKPLDADVLICSDHAEAITAVSALTVRMPGLRPLEAGSLSSAAALEAMTAVLLQLNRRYKTRAAIRVTGAGIPASGVMPAKG
jgi:8-hydroxy-5-deazaflavin:NADPH oxidoreductase